MNTVPQSVMTRTWRRFGPRLLKRWASVLAIAVVVSAVAILGPHKIGMLDSFEKSVRDKRIAAMGSRMEARSDIAVLGITEDTLDTLPYRSPVDRDFLANVLRFLQHAHVRGVIVDILFTNPTEPAKDAALQEVMRHFPAPLVIAWGPVGAQITQQQHDFMARYLDGIARGYGNLYRDPDGAVRTLKVHWETGSERFLGLAAVMAGTLGAPLPERDIPLDYILDPNKDTPAIPMFRAEYVVPQKDGSPPILPPAFFTGKIVLIGADLLEQDRFLTPFAAYPSVSKNVLLPEVVDGWLPGVVIHAQSLAQLLDDRRLWEADITIEIVLVALTVVLGLALSLLDVALWVRLTFAGLGLLAIWIVLLAAYGYAGYLLPVISPTIGYVLAVAAMSFYQQRRFLQERRFIRGALSRYVAEDVVAQLELDPSRLKLGGERRDLTYLFTDIAGFTSLSESAEPTVLAAALNAYFDGTSRIVLEHHGSIDKYIGDALVANFGAFSDDGKHPMQAAACAVALDAFASQFSAEQARKGLAFGITRIGVNSGSAIIGNFGGEKRFNYTAIGDTVNTAARLEGANKYLGTRVCIAASTASRCPDLLFRPAARLFVKGKQEGIDVFEPLGPMHPARDFVADYDAAYALLRAGDPAARAAFEKLAELHPDDPLVALHRQRLAKGETGVDMELEGK